MRRSEGGSGTKLGLMEVTIGDELLAVHTVSAGVGGKMFAANGEGIGAEYLKAAILYGGLDLNYASRQCRERSFRQAWRSCWRASL